MQQHQPVDRAAMIEAASRSLRQQMGRARDRPRSKGGFHEEAYGRDRASASGESGRGETSQRRNRSTENEHRRLRPVPSGDTEIVISQPSTAMDNYPSEEQPPSTASQDDAEPDVQVGELKRPQSRRKNPAESAAAGLGHFSNPAKLTDAFEQRRTRQPIPIESWGPRPPSRQGLPSTAAIEAHGEEPARAAAPRVGASSSVGRSSIGGASSSVGRPGSRRTGASPMEQGGTWADARHQSEGATRRTRDARRGTPSRGSHEDLGFYAPQARAPHQTLSESLSGVFDHGAVAASSHSPYVSSPFGGAWGSPDDGALEVTGQGLGDGREAPWPGAALAPASPAACASPPTRRGRNAELVSVEDVNTEDFGAYHSSLRREVASPQVIVTRSSQPGNRRGVPTRNRERRGQQRDQNSTPFPTSLDKDFLSLFAS